MSKLTDGGYLRGEQYRDASKLNARIGLYRFSTHPVPWHRWVFEQFRLPATGRILELGCGPATLWAENLERIPRGWDITLADFSSGMLEEARRALGPYEGYFRFQMMDAQTIPFADRTLDGVIANHMLYHVPGRPRALGEIARVLKPGGMLYAATGGPSHLKELDELLAQVHLDGLPHRAPRASDPFDLENGAEQLMPYFASVAMRRHKNELRVTEAEPLVAYILSLPLDPPLGEAERQRLREVVEGEIAAHGAITLTTDAGMFQAIKARER
jgi:ubiquinone/menaquinone biosynthesis C-methylase UbiE